MELYLRITAGLLLFVHLALLEDTTESTGRTIDKSWLRKPFRDTAGSQNATVNEDGSGTASGFVAVNSEEENNVNDLNPNPTAEILPVDKNGLAQNGTMGDSGFPSPTASPSVPTNSTQVDVAQSESSTATPPTSTGSPHPYSNRTERQPTALAPQTNATREPTTEPIDSTRSNGTTPGRNTSGAVSPSAASTSPASTSAASTTPAAANTPAKANDTDKDAAAGSSSERGFASDPTRNKRHVEWAAVLGTMVAVTIVGLVAYIVLRSRRDKGFSHRKLVEEYPSDPVLRLDNSEPLDLNFGGSAHYNPGLQGDNIQMTSLPGRH